MQVSRVLWDLLGDVCQPFYYEVLGLDPESSLRNALRVRNQRSFLTRICSECPLTSVSPLLVFPFSFSFLAASHQVVAGQMRIPGQTLPVSLGGALHLGRPAEPQRDGHLLLGDGESPQ